MGTEEDREIERQRQEDFYKRMALDYKVSLETERPKDESYRYRRMKGLKGLKGLGRGL